MKTKHLAIIGTALLSRTGVRVSRILLLFWLFLVPAITSCSESNRQSQSSPSPTEISNNKPIIYVTNYPLKYFGDRKILNYGNLDQ